ncbi:hypothetical protein GQ600_9224 [Phytophthora cactorum]|nr:hypothetical protein GQ600_9224 [Phytophthora cactorum]
MQLGMIPRVKKNGGKRTTRKPSVEPYLFVMNLLLTLFTIGIWWPEKTSITRRLPPTYDGSSEGTVATESHRSYSVA